MVEALDEGNIHTNIELRLKLRAQLNQELFSLNESELSFLQ
jgi:hypothetical protein